MRVIALVIGIIACTLQFAAAQPEANPAVNPVEYCRQVLTDDDPGPVPPSLVPAFIAAFGLSGMSPAQVQRSSKYRCYRGRVFGCTIGANLNCGKANISKRNQGGDEWCRTHPNDADIPAAATGHATVYTWRCAGARAVPTRQFSNVDARGFEAMNWKPLD